MLTVLQISTRMANILNTPTAQNIPLAGIFGGTSQQLDKLPQILGQVLARMGAALGQAFSPSLSLPAADMHVALSATQQEQIPARDSAAPIIIDRQFLRGFLAWCAAAGR